MLCLFRLGGIGLIGLSLGLVAVPVTEGTSGDEAPHARAYMDWLDNALEVMSQRVPAITQTAEEAVGPVIEGSNLSVLGDDGLAQELAQRTGWFISITANPPSRGDVVLLALGIATSHEIDTQAMITS